MVASDTEVTTETSASEEETTEAAEEKEEAAAGLPSIGESVDYDNGTLKATFELTDGKVFVSPDSNQGKIVLVFKVTNNGSEEIKGSSFNMIVERNGETAERTYGTDESGKEWENLVPETIAAGASEEWVVVLKSNDDDSTPVNVTIGDYGNNKVEMTINIK